MACLNCATCSTGVFTPDSVLQCENLGLCGPLERCLVTRKSGAWDEAPQTRYQISEQGKKLAAAVRVGDIVGAECANETEPYILFEALPPPQNVAASKLASYIVDAANYDSMSAEYRYNWMGEDYPTLTQPSIYTNAPCFAYMYNAHV